MLSLRWRLVLLAMALTLMATLSAVAMAWWMMGGHLLQREEQVLTHHANDAATRLDDLVAESRMNARMLAAMPAVQGLYRAAAAGGVDPITHQGLEAWRGEIREDVTAMLFEAAVKCVGLRLRLSGRSPEVLLYVGRDPGSPYPLDDLALAAGATADPPGGLVPLPGPESSAESVALIASHRAVHGTPTASGYIARITAPVVNPRGQQVGILELDLDLDEFRRSLDTSLIPGRTVRLLDAGGDDLFRPASPTRWNVAQEYPRFGEVFAGTRDLRRQARMRDRDGHTHLLSLQGVVLDGTGTTVRILFASRLDSVLSVMYEDMVRMLPGLVLILSLSLLASAVFANELSVSLRRLIGYVSDWVPGQTLDEAILARRDEIGVLARRFSALLRILTAKRAKLLQQVGEVEAARRQASEAEARLHSIFNNMLDGVIVIDVHGTIISINPSAERLTGYDHGELLGQPFTLLVSESRRAQLMQRIDAASVVAADIVVRAADTLILGKDGRDVPVAMVVSTASIGDQQFYSVVLRDRRAQHAAETETKRLLTAIESTTDAITIQDKMARLVYVNPAFERLVGLSSCDILGHRPDELMTSIDAAGRDVVRQTTLATSKVWHGTYHVRLPSGAAAVLDACVSAIMDDDGDLTHYTSVMRDVTLKRISERDFARANKLEAIGQLAAGIAHEINTPAQYVGDNLNFIRDELGGLMTAMSGLSHLGSSEPEIRRILQTTDLSFLQEELPRAIDQSIEGCGRIATIVRAMKEFSHPSLEKVPSDLNRAIQSTITVATNEWKYVADVSTNLDPQLPPVACQIGEINQVILNMLVNAAHAIAEVVGDGGRDKGRITVTTALAGQLAEIRITDTGAGIRPDHLDRIFDPFFTTKPVGCGTGQGLAIAHDVIVRKHQGSIRVESQPGTGSTFIIRLPVEARIIADGDLADKG